MGIFSQKSMPCRVREQSMREKERERERMSERERE